MWTHAEDTIEETIIKGIVVNTVVSFEYLAKAKVLAVSTNNTTVRFYGVEYAQFESFQALLIAERR